jgi:Tfp pilus assembly protein PilX
MCITKLTKYRSCRSANAVVFNRNGSALIVSLVVLVALAIIGMIALQFSANEVRIAASDRNFKESFYAADGTMELASELLEQNIESVEGFAESVIGGKIAIVNSDFWTNEKSEGTTPSDNNRDFFMPSDAAAGQPRTNFKLGGTAGTTPGSAIQMAAGYEGRGKAAGQGGTHLVYRINAQHIGQNENEAVVRIEWRHVN